MTEKRILITGYMGLIRSSLWDRLMDANKAEMVYNETSEIIDFNFL